MTFKTARLQGITRSEQVELKAAFCDAALYRLWLDNLQRDEHDVSSEKLDDSTRIGNLLNVSVSRVESFASKHSDPHITCGLSVVSVGEGCRFAY